jgi:hypothetical protein
MRDKPLESAIRRLPIEQRHAPVELAGVTYTITATGEIFAGGSAAYIFERIYNPIGEIYVSGAGEFAFVWEYESVGAFYIDGAAQITAIVAVIEKEAAGGIRRAPESIRRTWHLTIPYPPEPSEHKLHKSEAVLILTGKFTSRFTEAPVIVERVVDVPARGEIEPVPVPSTYSKNVVMDLEISASCISAFRIDKRSVLRRKEDDALLGISDDPVLNEILGGSLWAA